MRSSRWSSRGRSARSSAALAALLFAVYALTIGAHAEPGSRVTGAEAHVLLTTDSIAHDHDLDLRNQYARKAWRSAFHEHDLTPSARADAAGRILEPQGIGLPLLLAPTYHLGGTTLVRLLLAALAAIAVACGAALARRVVPDPWPMFAALGLGLSPPMVAAATAVRPEIPAAAALAGAALLALRVRDEPDAAPAFWAAVLLALVPWIALTAVLPAIVIALAMFRWQRRRRRGLAGFAALEVVLVSAVVYITVNDKLFGGMTPYAARLHPGPATGVRDAGDVLDRVPRVLELLGELLRWAPITALALAGGWLLVRVHGESGSRRWSPTSSTPRSSPPWPRWSFSRPCSPRAGAAGARHRGSVVPHACSCRACPFLIALDGPGGLRRFPPRTGAALGAVTVALSAWLLIGPRVDAATQEKKKKKIFFFKKKRGGGGGGGGGEKKKKKKKKGGGGDARRHKKMRTGSFGFRLSPAAVRLVGELARQDLGRRAGRIEPAGDDLVERRSELGIRGELLLELAGACGRAERDDLVAQVAAAPLAERALGLDVRAVLVELLHQAIRDRTR